MSTRFSAQLESRHLLSSGSADFGPAANEQF
jgi:hypothetical protein